MSPLDRPDWVPPMWTRGRLNRWFWQSPLRMVVWLCVAPLLAAAVAFGATKTGSGWWWVLLAAAIFGAAQAAIYVPRAWRAYRAAESK